MPIAITKKPFRTNEAGVVSRWNAAFAPFVYEGRRIDFIASQGINATGKLAIYLGPNPNINVGDLIYVSGGQYDGTFEVLQITNGYYKLNTQFISGVSSAIVNLVSSRKNYFIDFEIYNVTTGNAYQIIGTSIIRPLPNGTFKLDLASTIQKSISFKNEGGKYDWISKINLLVSGQVNIRFRENWQGVTLPFSALNEKISSFYVGAAKQLKDKFGSNMAKYALHTKDIGLFNGNFEISTTPTLLLTATNVSGWQSSIAGSSIINGQFINANASHPVTTNVINLKPILVALTQYTAIIDVETLKNAKIKLVFGTTESSDITSEGLSKVDVIANNFFFGIKIISTAANSQVKINGVNVYETVNPNAAKFLVENLEPTYFKNYPFDISFIHSDLISDFKIRRRNTFLNNNKTTIATAATNLPIDTNKFAVNRMIIGATPAGTKFIDTSVEIFIAKKTGIHTGGVFTVKTFKTGTAVAPITIKNIL